MNQIVDISPYKIAGETISTTALLPFFNVSSYVDSPSLVNLKANGFGLGDLTFGPVLQGPIIFNNGRPFLMRLRPALAPAAPAVPVETYQALLEASSMSGLAYGISGLGVGHAICHSLAGRWDISHGNANAVILRHSVGFNLGRAPERLALASRAIGGADLAASLAALCETLQTPRTLRDVGLPEAQFDLIAADVLADPVTMGNPGTVSRDDVKLILAACW